MQHWTPEEVKAALAEGVCEKCQLKKVDRIEDTCEHCPLKRKRGRPRGTQDSTRRQVRRANGGPGSSCANASSHGVGPWLDHNLSSVFRGSR